MYKKKDVSILITGQMRTFKKCINNLFDNIINCNENYNFKIYILTEFFINDGGTPKNIYNYDFNNIDEFENDIKNSYGINLKFLFIESEHNKITYPDYINNYGPWKVLYKNYVLYNKIHNELCLNNENIIIRMRPDIVITNPLILNNIILNNNILIVSSIQSRNNSWYHNRDWDHMLITNNTGYKLWSNYCFFLDIKLDNFDSSLFRKRKTNFNNKGFWIENIDNFKNDYIYLYSIIATQLFSYYIEDNRYTIEFDLDNVYTTPIRI